MEQKITSVESSGKRSERSKKTLDHIEIHPRLGGGAIIRHQYAGYEHKPEDHNFKQDQGEKFAAHLAKHTGFPLSSADRSKASETEEEIEA